MKLSGKMALITGGGTGIGAAIAERFVVEGARICIAGRRKDILEKALRSYPPGSAVICVGDVSKPEDARRMVDEAVAFGGKLDVLVNNAGINPRGSVIDLDPGEWQMGLAVNLTGPFLLMQAAIPLMMREGGGSIINISSLGGVRSMPSMAAYCVSKAGVIMLTQQAAVDFGRHNVRVNAICPGGIGTDMMDGAIRRYAGLLNVTEEDVSALVSSGVPMGRIARPSEIAGTCVYLASDDSSFTNGAIIMVDGGASVLDAGRVAVAKALKDAGK
jgi:meso-butanediol dehydrogenase / (S,S)-butanediol dehydrogenase / diacetyl reductase